MNVPTPGERAIPTGTYRWQIHGAFGFASAAAQADYLAALGVSHAYLSPILQPAPGSTHGYDVIDHGRLNEQAGGRAAFDELIERLHAADVRAVADVVPNHMAVPTPAFLNTQLWSVLRDGPGSPYASWFDVDWSAADRAILMPVLGQRIGQVLDAGELRLDDAGGHDGVEVVLRYYDHQFPVRPGTEHLPLPELVDRQWYRLAHWRVADEELNYRRFFDVDTLAAVRVERPEVFEATHRLLLDLLRNGSLDGLRIDHPDGLADPRGYLAQLAEATAGAWVVVEKILDGSEQLPRDWQCAGTTGYDALQRIGGLFVDPAGAAPLSELLTELTGEVEGLAAVVDTAKREVVAQSQYAEVHRLVDLLAGICHDDVRMRDHTRRGLLAAVTELLVTMDRYRAYVEPGEPAPAISVQVLHEAAERAAAYLPEHEHDTLHLVRDLVLGQGPPSVAADPRRDALVVRFQQTCGPVMAKGVEDTAWYRWMRLVALNEVGGDPEHFGVAPEELHAFFGRLQATWPAAMTTLSTHDTKRSEDVRAQLSVLSERPQEWTSTVRGLRDAAAPHREPLLDPATEYLVWQTVIGTWAPAERNGAGGPIGVQRLHEYMQKAVREAKTHTSWTAPDEDYERALHRFVDGVLTDPAVLTLLEEWARSSYPAFRVAALGQKLLQLAGPGVPDVYQGTELVDLSLVDPDNRRPVDYDGRRTRLAALDAGESPGDLSDEKLLVTSRALRLRRAHPSWFSAGSYLPVATTTGNAVAFGRGAGGGDGDEVQVVAVATRLAVSLADYGGWREHTLMLAPGQWQDVLTGRKVDGGAVRLADLLVDLPVALLVRVSA